MYHDDGNERPSEILVLISYDKTLGAFSLPSLSALSFITMRAVAPLDEDKIIVRTIIEAL